jgi:uncharacterized protein
MRLTYARHTAAVCAIVAAATLAPAPATAQSFDCRKATTDVEKMICADTELSKLDVELAQTFAEARKRVDPVVIGQPTWLRIVRNRCTAVPCVKDAYYSRVSYLRELNPASAFPLGGLDGDWTRVGSTRTVSAGVSISNVGPDSFDFSLFAHVGDRIGALEGTATTRGGSVFYRDDTDTNCQVTFAMAGPRLVVVTSPECSGFGGMGVTFEGEYGKGEGLLPPPPFSEAGILAKGVPESAFTALVGQDYDLFQNSIDRFSEEKDLDGLGMHVISGYRYVGGFREGEAIIMSRADGTIFAAVVDDLVVKYYSTDPRRARTLPKTIEEWRTRAELTELKVVFISAR